MPKHEVVLKRVRAYPSSFAGYAKTYNRSTMNSANNPYGYGRQHLREERESD